MSLSRAGRIVVGLAVAVAVGWVLFTLVFPWVDQLLNDPALVVRPPR